MAPLTAMDWQKIGGKRLVVTPEPRFDGTEAFVEEGSLLSDWMRRFGRGAAVVRPDKYVFGLAHDRRSLQQMVEQVVEALNLATPYDNRSGHI
jgi:3-(3-hydroxy-phenyl)propionate hydroxylase